MPHHLALDLTTQGATLPNKGHLWPNSPMESSIPSQYLLVLIALAGEQGYSMAALCEGTALNLDALSSPGTRVEEHDADRIIANALMATGDPALGLAVGQQLNLGAHAVIGQTFMACADLVEVLDTLVRYGPLITGSNTELSRYEDPVNDRAGLMLSLESPPLSRRFSHEAIFSAAQKTISDLLQMPTADLEVHFPYASPADTTPLTRIFGEKIRFNADSAILSLPGSLMRQPVPTSNPILRTLYDAECARLLADLSDTASYAERTLTALDKLQGQYPQLEQMAAMLHLSPRTYRRRLQQESTTFQVLLDTIRLKHAKQYLRNDELSVDRIALLLGFNDASNFRRAFMQWSEASPTQWRKISMANARLPKTSDL